MKNHEVGSPCLSKHRFNAVPVMSCELVIIMITLQKVLLITLFYVRS